MQKIDLLYREALLDILENGIEQEDKRLFHKEQAENRSKTKAISGLKIQFDLKKDGFPLLSLRKLPVKLFTAEAVWFLKGDNTTEPFFKKFAKIWEDFTEEDGTVTSYGHRWRNYFGRDQVYGVLETLRKDPTSRHGVMITWDPASDSLVNGVKRKNVPCQIGMVIDIINGRLNMHSIWRSVDMILGFPHDVTGNALLAYIFAAYLGVEPGLYTHFITNAHIYGNHYEYAEELAKRETKQEKIELSAKKDWFDRASAGDEELVYEIIEILKQQYTDFGEPMKRIKIVV